MNTFDWFEDLTPAQQNIISIIYAWNYNAHKCGFFDLAYKTGLAVPTVTLYLRILKRRGIVGVTSGHSWFLKSGIIKTIKENFEEVEDVNTEKKSRNADIGAKRGGADKDGSNPESSEFSSGGSALPATENEEQTNNESETTESD